MYRLDQVKRGFSIRDEEICMLDSVPAANRFLTFVLKVFFPKHDVLNVYFRARFKSQGDNLRLLFALVHCFCVRHCCCYRAWYT